MEAEPTSAVIGWDGVAEGEGGVGADRCVGQAVLCFTGPLFFTTALRSRDMPLAPSMLLPGCPCAARPLPRSLALYLYRLDVLSERCFVPCIKQGLLVLRSNLVVHYRRVKYPLSWPRP